MIHKKNIVVGNEEGSAIIFALMILAVLTILGISTTSTTNTELKIVSNEKQYQRDFYIADSIWKYGAYWLEESGGAPATINDDISFSEDELKIVRNFGDAAANDLNDTFVDGTEDGLINSIPYWYNAQYDRKEIVAGSSLDYRKFYYIVQSNANKKQEIEVRVSKVYKVGY